MSEPKQPLEDLVDSSDDELEKPIVPKKPVKPRKKMTLSEDEIQRRRESMMKTRDIKMKNAEERKKKREEEANEQQRIEEEYKQQLVLYEANKLLKKKKKIAEMIRMSSKFPLYDKPDIKEEEYFEEQETEIPKETPKETPKVKKTRVKREPVETVKETPASIPIINERPVIRWI